MDDPTLGATSPTDQCVRMTADTEGKFNNRQGGGKGGRGGGGGGGRRTSADLILALVSCVEKSNVLESTPFLCEAA